MYWTTIYHCPHCNGRCSNVIDRSYRRCMKCGKLVSKNMCEPEKKIVYDDDLHVPSGPLPGPDQLDLFARKTYG